MRTAPLLVATLAMAMAVACDQPSREVSVGEHRLFVAVPSGWQTLDQGRQLVFRKDSAELELVLSDLGAVRPEGLRKEVMRARDLWRDGRESEARSRLREVPLRKELFATRDDYERFLAAWQAVEGVPLDTSFATVNVPFDQFLQVIDSTQPPTLEAIADDALPRLGHDERRFELRSRQTTRVDGREAIAVETWRSLTHTDPRRFLIVVNEGRVLALRCDRCSDPVMAEGFDQVSASLHFASAPRT